MSIKDNVIFSLNRSRQLLDGLIESMKSPEDWTHQTCPNANHGLWVIGHLALADNMFAGIMQGIDAEKPEGWEELFWFGSEVHGDASKYPPIDEVLAYLRERRENLLKVIDGLSEEFLNSPTPDEGFLSDAPNMASMLIFVAYHEGIHTGQFTIAHRGLGHQPMFKPEVAEA